MGEWVRKKISEVGQVISGATPSTSRSDFWSGDIIWITPTDLSKNKTPFIQDSERKISEAGLQNCSAFVVASGNLVLSSRAPIGYFAIVNANFTTNQGCKSVIFNKGQYPLFHYYNFLFRVKDFKEKGEGTTFAEISKSVISKLEFPAPDSFHEQTTIASILITIDQSIEKTEQLIAKYERIKKGLMQDLLTRGIDKQGNIRSEETHEFKDSPLGRIPKDWEVKQLIELSTLVTNGFVGVATPYYSSPSKGVPYLYGNNVRKNRIDLKQVTYVNREFHSKHKKSQLRPGDMLTVQSGHIGTTAIVPESLTESNCHALIITKFKNSILEPNFISLYCNYCLDTGSMSHLFVGSTIKHINTSDLAKFLLPFPSKTEQYQIVQKVNSLEESLDIIHSDLVNLYLIKQGLMQDLLTGKVRVDSLINCL